MARTPEEALAWISTISKGAPRVHLEAVLGLACVPTLEDFDYSNEDSLRRCRALIAHLRETLDALEAIVEQREKVAESEQKRQEDARRLEEANTIPGVPLPPPEPPAPAKKKRRKKK